ncbi:MAG: SAM-dependent methyltransferase [Anaerolineales bacterium]|nr:SAM-dependent methyltransferase [Anaerolineales bacterium]
MPDNLIEQKPSQTALFTALRRALAHLAYGSEKFGADHLAIHFLPLSFRFFLKFEKIRANTREKLAAAFPGMNEYLIARTAFFDGLFLEALQNGTPQIVLLGAGYDSRAYRFAGENRGSCVFELDAAPTQRRKVQCLKAARIDVPEQVTFVPVNFNQEVLGEVLAQAGYRSDAKALFLWEGVSYYLEPAAVDATLAFISQAAPGSQIAFDYAVPIRVENQGQYYGAKEFIESMQRAHANEEIRFALADEEIGLFLEQRGLKLIQHLNHEEIERAYLLNEGESLLGQIPGFFRFVVASPGVCNTSGEF